MKFEIDFNHFDDLNNTEEFFKSIGAKWVDTTMPETSYYEIELNTFEELAELMKKINQKLAGNNFKYSAIMNFEAGRGTIYLDDDC